MRIAIRWWQPASKREDPALTRFRAVLGSAAGTHYYRPWLAAARLLSPGQRERLATLPEALVCLPRVELRWFLQHQTEFESRHACGYKPSLEHPCEPAPRTAILAPGFESRGNARCFRKGDQEGLLKFGPECLAGPAETMLEMAHRGRTTLPAVRHSVVVFSDLRRGLLSESDRDALWNAFRVPVFEQLRGLSGELLAAECEAHNGLHVCARDAVLEFDGPHQCQELLFTSLVNLAQPAIRLATGWSPTLDDSRCACGTLHPRLLDLAAIGRTQALAGAAAC